MTGPAAKLLVFIPKRNDISAARFHEHWRTVHAELALKISSLDRYVQNHRMPRWPDTFPPAPLAAAPFLGISEAWLADENAVDAMGTDPEYLDGARLDEPNFMDVESKCNLICRELSPAGPGRRDADAVKTFVMLQAPARDSLREFYDLWGDSERWRQARQIPSLQDVTLNIPVAADYVNRRPAPFDLVVEMWWQSDLPWDSTLNTAVGLFASRDGPSLGTGSMALAARETRFL